MRPPSGLNAPEICGREFAFGNLRLEADGTLTRGDELIHLPPKELAALRFLLANASRIVTHQQLKQALWGDVHVTDDSVPKCMSSLRELLAPDDCIQTIYKKGYRLAARVLGQDAERLEGLPRLLIMPFAVDVTAPAYLGPAIAEETISLLTSDPLSPARVLARDSAFSLAARGLTAHQAGEALHADLILTGTLRSMPAHFRLRVEMIRPDGTQIWVEDMLVPQQRAAALEAELARRLFVRLSTADWFSQSAGLTETDGKPGHREAYDLFLRGHHEWQGLQRHRMQDGIQHLARAVELDPSLYSARIDLAHASILQAFCGFISPSEAAEQVCHVADTMPAAEGTEAILPALGWIRFSFDHDLPGALRAFDASAHLPDEAVTTRLRSMLALSRHRFNEAIEMLTETWHADPYSPWLGARLAWAYHLAGERVESVAQAEHALDLFPDRESTNIYGSLILAYNGKTERAIAVSENLVRRSPYFDLTNAIQAYALACGGRKPEARSILERLQWLSRERFVLSSFTPAVYIALGDLDAAIRDLQAAAEARCPWFFQMLADPRLEALRDHPEFIRMRKMLERMESSAAKRMNHQRQVRGSDSSTTSHSGITP